MLPGPCAVNFFYRTAPPPPPPTSHLYNTALNSGQCSKLKSCTKLIRNQQGTVTYIGSPKYIKIQYKYMYLLKDTLSMAVEPRFEPQPNSVKIIRNNLQYFMISKKKKIIL